MGISAFLQYTLFRKGKTFSRREAISAPDRKSLIYRTRALDRVLLFGYYVIPHWHLRHYRVAYWNKIARPKISPKYDLGFDTWWIQ